MKILLLTITLLFSGTFLNARQLDTSYPEVGKPMPDFELNDVLYYSKKKVKLGDFAGKWLILDFWNQYCGPCLASHPKINMLQKKFKNEVQFMLVGYTGSQYIHVSNDKTVRALYERNRQEEKLDLSIAYDSVLMHRYKIKPTPYIIIIDPKGIVRGITTSVTEQNLKDLVAGNAIELDPAYHGGEREKAKREKIERMNRKKGIK